MRGQLVGWTPMEMEPSPSESVQHKYLGIKQISLLEAE